MSDVIVSCDMNTTSDNLEDVYMELHERDAENILFHNAWTKLEYRIEDCFSSYPILDNPTVHDFPILALTKKDLIATFYCNPLLIQAYQRCVYYTKNLHGLLSVMAMWLLVFV